ncbi:hypothetical protein BE20_12835 [Sorangium cellulosum]|uniref:Lipoprotein n=1 Tax=Sorangium cellulosum TaxID=56 RepID=A0A150SI97_SORCE|nr:hypothetical protein BE20_12835 [Sorangium cellulosum]KYF98259.1 hypothetical protein BE18_18145 [Sorangium cellulosum]
MLSRKIDRSVVALAFAAGLSACGGAAQTSTNPGASSAGNGASGPQVLASQPSSPADQRQSTTVQAAPAPQPPILVTGFTDVTARFTDNRPKLQSFAFARFTAGPQYWIFIAGRNNGFHGFKQPDEDFPAANANTKIWVIGDVYGSPTVYSMDVALLPSKFDPIKPQWMSSNPLFYQDYSSGLLYIAGGYGPDIDGTYKTFPILSVVKIQDLVSAVTSNDSSKLNNSIAYVSSPLVQATGAEMLKLADGNFYVVMGHNFQGKYSDFITNNQQNNAKASQTYLKAINQFRATPNFTTGTIALTPGKVFSNADQFGRRDLNVAYTVMQDGQAGIGAYGGVFTPNPQQLNYYFPIYLGQGQGTQTPIIDTSYEQKMSAYSCAKVVLYSKAKQATYTTFFGGISRWRFDYTINEFVENARIGDPSVPNFSDGMPWINTITTLAHTWTSPTTGTTSEVAQPTTTLPGYLGSEALFIPRTSGSPSLNVYQQDIIDLDALPKGTPFSLGYLYGGTVAMPSKFYQGVQVDSGQTPTAINDKIYEVFIQIPRASN